MRPNLLHAPYYVIIDLRRYISLLPHVQQFFVDVILECGRPLIKLHLQIVHAVDVLELLNGCWQLVSTPPCTPVHSVLDLLAGDELL